MKLCYYTKRYIFILSKKFNLPSSRALFIRICIVHGIVEDKIRTILGQHFWKHWMSLISIDWVVRISLNKNSVKAGTAMQIYDKIERMLLKYNKTGKMLMWSANFGKAGSRFEIRTANTEALVSKSSIRRSKYWIIFGGQFCTKMPYLISFMQKIQFYHVLPILGFQIWLSEF